MSRLEAGALKVKREPHDIQDVIGSALRDLQNPQDRKILVDVQPELPLVWIDFLLIVNVLVNLLDNAYQVLACGFAGSHRCQPCGQRNRASGFGSRQRCSDCGA